MDIPNIRFQTVCEFKDVQSFTEDLCKDKRNKDDPFWVDAAQNFLTGVMLHLMYKHNREGKLQPTLKDIQDFFHPFPEMSLRQTLEGMMSYPHITPKMFLEIHGRSNPLKAIYGNYITNIEPFKQAFGIKPNTPEWEDLCDMNDLQRLLVSKVGKKKPSKFFAADPWRLLLVHPKVAVSALRMQNAAAQTRASIWQTVEGILFPS